MLRLALILAAAVAVVLPAQAQDNVVLRLSCLAGDPAMSPPLAFVIDVTAKDAVETVSGTHYGVTPYRDGLGLFDPAQGPGATVYRIDRVSGRFARVDLPSRWTGTCDTLSPKP